MRILLVTLLDVGFKKNFYRLIFDIKKLFFFLLPSKVLEKVYFYDKKYPVWEKRLFQNFKLSSCPPQFKEKNKKLFYFKFLNKKRRIYFPNDWKNKSQSKLSISQDYPYQEFSLQNMSIQDKQYKEIIKSDYDKMINNYKERITNKTFAKSLKESIKLQEKVESKKQRSLTKTLKRKSKSKSPSGIMELV